MTEFFIGCDVSKGYADFIVIDSTEKVIERTFQIDDTFEGHNALCDFLSRFFRDHKEATLCVGLESTGGYENNWYSLFMRIREVFNLKITRLNPLAIKAHNQASMRRTVTDDVSALNIASYLIAYRNKVNYEQEDAVFTSVRKQWNFVQMLLKQKTQLSNQLGFLMYQSHPQLVRYCNDRVPNWVMSLLEAYPTAAKLARARAATVAKIPFVSADKANQLIEEARCSVAGHVDETDAFVIKETIRQIKALSTAIASQKERMEHTCTMPEVELLTSIKGIGVFSAIGLMINIVSVARFNNVKKLASYFGLHPVYRQSGDGTFGMHMSKKGRVEPRAILYMAVLSALTCNPVIKELYTHCVARGMSKKAAIGVCMHKMLRIIYGMLRTNTAFDPAIDQKNQMRPHRKGFDRHVVRKRRLHPHDEKAPISGRQNKTRRENRKGSEPQKNSVLECEVIRPFQKKKNSLCSGTEKEMPTSIGEIIGPVLERFVLVDDDIT